jgi:hypothetical protein
MPAFVPRASPNGSRTVKDLIALMIAFAFLLWIGVPVTILVVVMICMALAVPALW